MGIVLGEKDKEKLKFLKAYSRLRTSEKGIMPHGFVTSKLEREEQKLPGRRYAFYYVLSWFVLQSGVEDGLNSFVFFSEIVYSQVILSCCCKLSFAVAISLIIVLSFIVVICLLIVISLFIVTSYFRILL